MLPFLFEHTFFETPTYFVLYLLAFLGAILLTSHRAKSFGLSPVRAIDIGMVIFAGGFLGARLFHILFERPDYYLQNPLKIFAFWQGGFVLIGGLVVGTIATAIFIWWKREDPHRWGDLIAPSLLLGIGIGRVACLSAGCCHGSVTDWWWGILFTHPRGSAPLHVVLHPTQILESLFGFLSCLQFLRIFSRPQRIEGLGFPAALLMYAIFRFFIEYLRGDMDRGFLFDGLLSTSQFLSICVVILCGAYMVWRFRATRSLKMLL